MELTFPERQLAIRRATAALCQQLAWVALHELPLPNGPAGPTCWRCGRMAGSSASR